jgi:hypothetical protein
MAGSELRSRNTAPNNKKTKQQPNLAPTSTASDVNAVK